MFGEWENTKWAKKICWPLQATKWHAFGYLTIETNQNGFFFPRTYSDAMRRKIVNQWRSKNQSCDWNRILWVWVVYFTLDISVVHLCFLLWQMRICLHSRKRNSILIQKTYENFCLKPQYGIRRGSTFRQSSSLNFLFAEILLSALIVFRLLNAWIDIDYF